MKIFWNQKTHPAIKLGAVLLMILMPASAVLSGAANSLACVKAEKTPHKRALLIGISKYQRKGTPDELANLNTELDVELLQKVLVEKFNFALADIVVLKNEQATKEAILAAWRKLVAETEKGDVVFTHYSGHGDSIPDDNKDEIDGTDEALVPFDYVSKKDFSRHIRDDEIGKILDELKLKQPGSVLISLDSCYSGTATRGDYAVRGGDPTNDDLVKPETESPSGLEDKGAIFPKEYVFLAAASPRQTAKETDYDDKQQMGVYSLALVEALTGATPRTTYRDLFERINDLVTTKQRDQNPQLEGSLDELVFDGTAIKQERFAVVKPLPGGKKEDKAILQTGKLHGATVQSIYALYESGTKNPNDKDAVKLAEGEIIETQPTSSIIKIARAVEAEKLRTARAFEIRHRYANPAFKVILQNVAQVKGGAQLAAEFIKSGSRGNSANPNAGFDLADFSEASATRDLSGEIYDVKIYPAGKKEIADKIVGSDFRGLIMERKDGSILAVVSENKKLTAEIKAALERENRVLTVKKLKESEDTRLKVELRLVPVSVELDSGGRVVAAEPDGEITRSAGGQPEMKVGDYFMLEIENKSALDVYVTVLNLRADGKIGPGFPQKVEGTPDNLIKSGQKLLIPSPYIFRVTEPLGEESFRAIATVEATDFTPLIDEELIRRGEGRGERGDKAAETPLGKILLAAQSGKRSGIVSTAPPSWATSSFTYLVKPR